MAGAARADRGAGGRGGLTGAPTSVRGPEHAARAVAPVRPLRPGAHAARLAGARRPPARTPGTATARRWRRISAGRPASCRPARCCARRSAAMPARHTWLCADPAYVQPDMTGARMLACGTLDLTAGGSRGAGAAAAPAVRRPRFPAGDHPPHALAPAPAARRPSAGVRHARPGAGRRPAAAPAATDAAPCRLAQPVQRGAGAAAPAPGQRRAPRARARCRSTACGCGAAGACRPGSRPTSSACTAAIRWPASLAAARAGRGARSGRLRSRPTPTATCCWTWSRSATPACTDPGWRARCKRHKAMHLDFASGERMLVRAWHRWRLWRRVA